MNAALPHTVRLARYQGAGVVAISEEPAPTCPPDGLLIQAEACGLCSGELMDWYMDRKVPHVFGHEVAGRVVESQDSRFPVGARVAPHHHAPCLSCSLCEAGAYVHCEQWKRTKLSPGGMSTMFGVPAENLNDCLLVDDLRAQDAALIEPLACVMKSLRKARWEPGERVGIIGLGVMGLLHGLCCGEDAVGFDLIDSRVRWAESLGIRCQDDSRPFDVVVVCPGTGPALEAGMRLLRPEGRLVQFAPLPPGDAYKLDLHDAYFRDIEWVQSYSCGPNDTQAAMAALLAGVVRAEQVVSDFVDLADLPKAYSMMKAGQILKAMVIF